MSKKYQPMGKPAWAEPIPPNPITDKSLELAVILSKLYRLSEPNGLTTGDIDWAETKILALFSDFAKAEQDKLLDSEIGWIQRNHLGKGFDGSDRWEQCAAEIIAHLETRKGESDG